MVQDTYNRSFDRSHSDELGDRTRRAPYHQLRRGRSTRSIKCTSTRNVWKEIEDKMTCTSKDISLSPPRLKASSLTIDPTEFPDELFSTSSDLLYSRDKSQQSEDLQCQGGSTSNTFSGLGKTDKSKESGIKCISDRGRDLSLLDRRARANRLLSKSCHEVSLGLDSSSSPEKTPSSGTNPALPDASSSHPRTTSRCHRRCQSNSNDNFDQSQKVARPILKGDSGAIRRVALDKNPRPTRDNSVGAVQGRRLRRPISADKLGSSVDELGTLSTRRPRLIQRKNSKLTKSANENERRKQ